jgi:CHAT domain-containing protein
MSKKNKKQWFFLLAFLFIFAAIIPSVVAEVTKPIPLEQTRSNNNNLVTQAQQLYREKQFEAAASLWQQAADNFARQEDNLNRSMALSNLSLTYQQLGQWQEADRAIKDSVELLKASPKNDRLFAQTLDIQGKLQRETGKAAEAIDTWQQAATIYQKLNNSAALIQNNLNQAQALQDLGLYPRACKKILSSLTIENISTCQQLEQLTTVELSTLALKKLGNVLLVMGLLERAQQILKTSLTIAEKLKYSQEIAAIYLSLGNIDRTLAADEPVRRQRQQYQQQALTNYDRVISLSNDIIIQQEAKLNQLGLLIETEKWSQILPLWQDIFTQINNLPLNRNSVYAQINFAHIVIELLAKNNPQPPANLQLPSVTQLDRLLIAAAENTRALGDKRSEAYALGNLGRLYELTGELSIAQTHTQQAIALTSSLDSPDVAYQYFWQLGRIQNRHGDTEKAIAAYTKAFNYLQSLRGEIATINPEVQFSFRDRVEPVYRELVELDFKSAQTLEKTGNKSESTARLLQARDVIESLQLAQLNNFFREACIDGKPKQIDEIDPNAAVIYPVVLADELGVLLSLPNKPPSLRTIAIAESEIAEIVDRIQRSLLTPSIPVTTTLPEYQKVYDWLIRPFEAKLVDNKIKTIAFVLDDDLRNIPMSILHDGQQYLVEKYALALTPGLQLLNPKPLTSIELNALTAGLSKIRSNFEPHRNFGNLPKVPEELQTIQKIGLTQRSLLDNQFTQQALKQNITVSASPIIHLATHAKFSSKAEDTFILSWDGRINIKQLDDLLRDDTFNRKNEIELLVLSACETASGDRRATLGLAGIAVQAGARSTLATLWSVVDESTAKIMGEFYRQLEETGNTQANKAEVLRQAQLTLLKDKKFNHPHFWSPFILVGNWQ